MKKLLTIFIMLSLAFTACVYSEDFLPAKIKDISDRKYEQAVIELIDNAAESIVISMYIIKPSKKGPVSLLANELAEALDRGVTVDIHLNTKYSVKNNGESDKKTLIDHLGEKGANIYEVDAARRMHDKLIIVDSRFIVEGSTNWSVASLKRNFESSSLIDSSPLAKIKLDRIKNRLQEQDISQSLDIKRIVREISTVSVKTALIEDDRYFPEMINIHGDRAMNIYLLLLKESLNWEYFDNRNAAVKFPISLEVLAQEVGLPEEWTKTAKRRQIIKGLRRLDTFYGLMIVDFKYGNDAWIVLKDIPGRTFPVKSSFFDPERLRSLSSSAKFVYLIKAFLAQEGKTLDDYSRKDISKRFNIGISALRKAIRELGGVEG